MKLLDLFDEDPDNKSGCSDILMKCLFSFIITYLILLGLSFIDYSEESQNWMSVTLLIVYPIVCFFNCIYMLFLYALNFDNGHISGLWLIVIESIFAISIYSGIGYLFSTLPEHVLFKYENGSMFRRKVFTENYQILFTYLLLTIFLVALKKTFSQMAKRK